uniref:Submaxillary gland androgen-regulated protein 2, isoform beta n=1 Tax=Mus musculus TaxID=10090 RepID=SMR2B_MOUSE|nr:RecName: Full=Submaxillary gland androgen-regulated protein 2, isoform beta; AltName: Full=Salivary protein MSG2, isoform beta; Flags: Precursor [Mus musculus]AAB93509.1 MSG2beta salivary protein [Mus musculus]AAB93514.1 MSG2beta salivary protein [Mus musculus]
MKALYMVFVLWVLIGCFLRLLKDEATVFGLWPLCSYRMLPF